MTHPNNQNEATDLKQQLEALPLKAQKAAHDFAKSFADHPNGCVYCDGASRPKPTQAEDGELDEILNQLSGESFDAAINNPDDYMLVVNKSVAEAKQQILSLKSTWQAEARREMLERLPEKRIVANPDEHELGWSRHEAEHFNETIDLMRERLEQ